MMDLKSIALSILFMVSVMSVSAQSDKVLGIWFNGEKDAKVEIFKNGTKFYGRVVWMEKPLNDQGKEAMDDKNPDPTKRTVKLMNMVFMKNFSFDSESGQWTGGEIYDPKNGKTYSCKMKLSSENHLEVRGYIGISMLGRTEHWERTKL